MQIFDAKFVRDVSEQVYRVRLGEKDTAKMIADAGGGDKGNARVRANSGSLDPLTRIYLDIFYLEVEETPKVGK